MIRVILISIALWSGNVLGQCNTSMLGYRTHQNQNMGIQLTSAYLNDSFLNEVGGYWNACGDTTRISTTSGAIPIEVIVEDGVGYSRIDSQIAHGELQSAKITIFTQYDTFCCGVQTRSEDNLKDELAHELGHALGLAGPSGCSGSMMNGESIQADGSVAPRNVTSDECNLANDIWTTPDEGCDPTSTCMQKRSSSLICCDNHSPILIDIDRNGFQLGGVNRPVTFDMYGNDDPIDTTWVLPHKRDVFLFHDINGNGKCDDGSELFGHGTRLILEGNILAPHGFAGLAQYDALELGGNEDGVITELDEVWDELALWYDRNADGVSRRHETWMIYESPISELEIHPSPEAISDRNGNTLKYWAKAHSDQCKATIGPPGKNFFRRLSFR
ncbi:MAG: hypothetical protein QNK37_00395 [Acidobacteriota bacterium]|nr:hypothetical protein [Acidobacteriota bacterium]